MDQRDWLVLPNLACRRCGIRLDVKATEKRPVEEFYALHPAGPCPLSSDGVRLDSEGKFIEKVWDGGALGV